MGYPSYDLTLVQYQNKLLDIISSTDVDISKNLDDLGNTAEVFHNVVKFGGADTDIQVQKDEVLKLTGDMLKNLTLIAEAFGMTMDEIAERHLIEMQKNKLKDSE